MNRNIYDTDCVTWSPQGRIFQIEYAAEATKQGTCCVGCRSKTHAVLVALRRTVSKLAHYNSKILRIDDHVGTTFSGITADAKIIVDQMRLECLNHKFVYETPAPVQKLMESLSLTSQKHTLTMGKRPYGVALLVAGVDKKGTHIYETHPSGDYDEYVAHAFGARCQTARTYLEENALAMEDAALDDVIAVSLRALATTITGEMEELSADNIHVAVVGVDQPFTILSAEAVGNYLTRFEIKAPAAA